MLYLDFRLHLKEREQVVALVERRELRPNVRTGGGLIALPRRCAHLSAGGGEIAVEREPGRTLVLFFTYRGIMDNFSGFVYCSDGQPPSEQAFHGDFKEVLRQGDRWFFAASH